MSRSPKLLDIHVYGDDVLRLRAAEVETIDDELLQFAKDLTHTMYKRDGVGLAAPQTGVSKRVIVVDPHWSKEGAKREPLVMINPEIESSDGETEMEEGCISVPGIYARVQRASAISVSFTDLSGERRLMKLSGYPAVVVQHEHDHLNGILFVDRLGTIAKLKVKRKLKELERKAVNGVNLRGED
ncbi:MAG TPA: peptide deformylase [Candidatus Syntrophosphaera sp.]|jgi:peptide deformylase|nr:peptide deformylase [Candidatus Syntrophosphaera sp.]HOU72059.1 peptide deformylase [Candidatus Syntrophosphaera sp.]HPK83554.1 peptide deformylase [Candidatus Syntrophosphaera sp.]HQG94061.1 peptide deformylase [Candidatus Syntrophosphaera sp.]HQK29940.1 peptide deformylase [Candidatus Syntrophosphaera sp.]